MPKRSRLEVIFDLLKIIRDKNNAIKPTPLLRFSNLSSQRFTEYISYLLDKGFVRETSKDGRKHYSLSDKGFRYLEKYRNIIDFIEDFDL